MPGGGGAGEESAPRVDTVIKLGGSVVTVKDKPYTPNLATLHAIAEKVSMLARRGERLLLVIGGGSYGHTAVAEARALNASTAEALAITENAMMELALLVSEAMTSHGVYTFVYPPHAFCKPQGLKPNCDWSIVARAVAVGATPLVYGDIYPANTSGYGIISGDELAMEAACSLRAGRVVYVGVVPGLLDQNGRPVPRLTVEEARRMLSRIGGSTTIDVTGGMRRKIEAVTTLWCRGVTVYLTGHQPHQLEECLLTSKCGTTITSTD